MSYHPHKSRQIARFIPQVNPIGKDKVCTPDPTGSIANETHLNSVTAVKSSQ